MKKEILHPEGLYRSPFYSQGVKITGGTLLFVAGQVSRDRQGNVVGQGNMFLQLRTVYENLKLALQSGGATLEDVVKTTIFVTNVEEFQKVSKIREEYFSKNPPPNTLIEIKRLAHPDLMVEIEAIAAINAPS